MKTNIVTRPWYTHICKSMLYGRSGANGIRAGRQKGRPPYRRLYVLVHKHYRAEEAEPPRNLKKRALNDEEGKGKSRTRPPLMKELHEMLVKWEANNTEVRALCGEKMKSTGCMQAQTKLIKHCVGFDKDILRKP